MELLLRKLPLVDDRQFNPHGIARPTSEPAAALHPVATSLMVTRPALKSTPTTAPHRAHASVSLHASVSDGAEPVAPTRRTTMGSAFAGRVAG